MKFMTLKNGIISLSLAAALFLAGCGADTIDISGVTPGPGPGPGPGPSPGASTILKGKVTDAFNEGVESCVIYKIGTVSKLEITDENGNYHIKLDKAGSYNITFYSAGHRIEKKNSVNINGTYTLDVKLTAVPTHIGNIYGRVMDLNTGEPIVGVNVQLWNSGNESVSYGVTDSDGLYSMPALLPAGNYIVHTLAIGYQADNSPVDTNPLSVSYCDVFLKKQ